MEYYVRRAFDDWEVGAKIFRSNVANFETLLSAGYIREKAVAHKWAKVRRTFPGYDEVGAVVDISEWRNADKLIDQGWLDPCEAPKNKPPKKRRKK